MILTIRTDKPEAEIGLFDADGKQLVYETWEAHRKLGETIHLKLQDLLNSNNSEQADIKGIIIYEGPGSFTGLRIGISVANALAYSLGVPIVGATGEQWIQAGLVQIKDTKRSQYVTPQYGADAHITQPKK